MAAIAVAAGAIASAVLRAALHQLGRKAEHTRWQGDDLLLNLLRSVLPWRAVIVGVWVAVLRLPLSPGYRNDTDHVLLNAVIVVVTFGAARTVAEVVRAGAPVALGPGGGDREPRRDTASAGPGGATPRHRGRILAGCCR